MKIQTNAGDVVLTAEMVVRGMVFQWGRMTITVGDPDADCIVASGERTPTRSLVQRADILLGCDPTIATRADCERYGVHGDAGAHGFAKIPAGGAIDLTVAENIRKGMLFRINGREVVAACDAQFAVAGSTRLDLLGCHPALARREDCERFGIPEQCEQFCEDAPLDAAAHGFARLRGGGAVDVRRQATHVAGMVLRSDAASFKWTVTTPGAVPMPPVDDLRFVGLDARHASPSDVRRLCCGARATADWKDERGEWHERMSCCTLAIGDHAEHEDIATGAKWPAKAKREPTPGVWVAQFDRGRMRDTLIHDIQIAKVRDGEASGTATRDERIAREVALTGDLAAAKAWSPAATAKPMAFHEGPTTGGEMRFSYGSESFAVPFARGETTDTIAARVRKAVEDARPSAPNGIRATGHNWNTLPMAPCAKCGGSVGSIINAMSVVLPAAGRNDGWRATASVCKACSAVVEANRGLYEIRDGWIVEKARAFALYVKDRSLPVTAKRAGNAWEVRGGAEMYNALAGSGGKPVTLTAIDGTGMRRVVPREVSIADGVATATLTDSGFALYGVDGPLLSPFAETVLGLDLAAGPSTSAVGFRFTAKHTCPNCGRVSRHCCEPIAVAFCRFVAGLKRLSAKRDERQQREAPLLALVAAVPEGLNPIGWRAAVLGYTDNPAPVDALGKIPRLAKMLGEFVRLVATGMSVDGAADRLFWIAAKEDDEMATGRVVQAMNNYARAIAPHKAPPPERKRGPRLPIDDGGHYE